MLRYVKRLWHSSTFTSWGSKLAASTRLFLVLPLLLNRFDEVQLAAWLLFGSIMFFGSVVGAQTSLVLSRMVSVAFGGAKKLEVISSTNRPESLGEPNWPLLHRLYGSMGLIDVLNALWGVVLGGMLGWFSLSSVTNGYDGASGIWGAFLVFIAGQFLLQVFRRYSVMLRGLNQVALSNRWEALFALLSALFGGATLMLGGSIIHLALVMQLFVVLGVVRQWLLLMHVVEPQFREVSVWRFDRQIISWVWEPLWRSCIRAVANRGSAKVAAVVLARNTEPATLSSILLSLRLLETLEDIAVTPMTSHVPRLGKLLAQGSVDQFRDGVVRALRVSCWIQALGIVAIGYIVYFGLEFVDSDTQFLGQAVFFALAISHLLASQTRQSLMISVIGNNIIAVGRLSCVAVISIVTSVFIIPHYPVVGFIFSAYFPMVVILNVYPLRCGCDLMGIGLLRFVRRTALVPWGVVALASVASLFMDWGAITIRMANSLKALW